MVTVTIDKPDPEYLAMIAMIESGIYDKETYNRTEHWNNKEDEVHKFWAEFMKLMEFNGYEVKEK